MKHLKIYETFDVEWKPKDLNSALEILFGMVEHAEEITGEDNLEPESAIIELKKYGTSHSLELADQIDSMLDLIAEFDVESEVEKSKLN